LLFIVTLFLFIKFTLPCIVTYILIFINKRQWLSLNIKNAKSGANNDSVDIKIEALVEVVYFWQNVCSTVGIAVEKIVIRRDSKGLLSNKQLARLRIILTDLVNVFKKQDLQIFESGVKYFR